MSASLTFNPDQSRTLDRRVKRLDVHIGSLLVTETDNPALIPADEGRDFDDIAGLTLYSPNGSKVTVTYFDEDDEPAIRGDSGGAGRSFESRTVKELRALAVDRGINRASKLTKDKLIEALRD